MQSVALRLIAEREAEREAFKPDEWWTVDPLLTNANGKPFRVSVRNACLGAVACVALCMQHHCLVLCNLKMGFSITNFAIAFCYKAGKKGINSRGALCMCTMGHNKHLTLSVSCWLISKALSH